MITKYQNNFKTKSPLLFFPMSVYDLSCKHDLSNSRRKEQPVYTQRWNWHWSQHCSYTVSMQNSGHWPFCYLCRAELTLQCQLDINDSNCLKWNERYFAWPCWPGWIAEKRRQICDICCLICFYRFPWAKLLQWCSQLSSPSLAVLKTLSLWLSLQGKGGVEQVFT